MFMIHLLMNEVRNANLEVSVCSCPGRSAAGAELSLRSGTAFHTDGQTWLATTSPAAGGDYDDRRSIKSMSCTIVVCGHARHAISRRAWIDKHNPITGSEGRPGRHAAPGVGAQTERSLVLKNVPFILQAVNAGHDSVF